MHGAISAPKTVKGALFRQQYDLHRLEGEELCPSVGSSVIETKVVLCCQFTAKKAAAAAAATPVQKGGSSCCVLAANQHKEVHAIIVCICCGHVTSQDDRVASPSRHISGLSASLLGGILDAKRTLAGSAVSPNAGQT